LNDQLPRSVQRVAVSLPVPPAWRPALSRLVVVPLLYAATNQQVQHQQQQRTA